MKYRYIDCGCTYDCEYSDDKRSIEATLIYVCSDCKSDWKQIGHQEGWEFSYLQDCLERDIIDIIKEIMNG